MGEGKAIPRPETGDWTKVPAPEECGEELVDLGDVAPEISYGAFYRRAGRPGAMERCWVRKSVAQRLKKAAQSLPEGYSLLVFDALRPLSVQKSLYEECWAGMKAAHTNATDEELTVLVDDFVAYPRTDPACPAPHTTGGAVDITLCRDGKPLDMGTEFDDNTQRAWADYFERNAENLTARENRRMLYHAMVGAGFVSYECEWWHFAYGERLWALRTGNRPIYGFRRECEERE